MLVGGIRYCKECRRYVLTKVILRMEQCVINNETIQLEAKVRICKDCGTIVYDEKFHRQFLIKACNIYRQKHNMLTPEQIKAIRDMYGLSKKTFAKLVNCCEKTIYRYEEGFLQDKEHNSLFVYLREPSNLRDYILHYQTCLEKDEFEKLLRRADNLIKLRV